MIPKGLKVGDTFEDGGFTYEVTKVVSDELYESKWVGDSLPTAPVITDAAIKTDYNSLPYAQLKKLCAERGLNAIGSKADLVSRLEG